MSGTTLWVVVALLGVAYLTAASAGLRAVSRIWLRHWVERSLQGRGIAPLSVEDVRRLLFTAGTTVALIAFGLGAVLGMRTADGPLVLLERGIITALLFLVVGQLIPRAIGRRWATTLVPVLVPPVRALALLLAPLVLVASELGRLGRRTVVSPPQDEERESLEDLLREGELEGVGDAAESAIITGIVDFSTKRARDVMTPREQMYAVDRNVPFLDAARGIAETQYTRVPVMDGDVDRIVGMWHAFDILKSDLDAAPALRPVVRAPATLPASDLLYRLLRERTHLAIVQDDTGRTLGLISLEDLLEELVGEIRDEHDEPTA